MVASPGIPRILRVDIGIVLSATTVGRARFDF